MLYFAYGSNMDWSQIRRRCPSARFVTVALLGDHRLAFTRYSNSWKCGVADAVSEEGAEIWGVVYEIPDTEMTMLDEHEGLRPGRECDKNAYNREERHVCRDGQEEKPLLVHVYFATPQSDPPRPNAKYKNLIVEGAEWWHLPSDYINQLKRIETVG
ncbi:MAG: gamma-glutamylcyclotransferase family protein [Phycisphaerales bacterium]